MVDIREILENYYKERGTKMNIGKACAVFEQINSDKYTEQQKFNAIKQVIEMPTHNGITKDCILNAFKWFFNLMVVESNGKQTQVDRILSMTVEELANFLSEVKYDGLYYKEDQKYPMLPEVWMYWLQSEVFDHSEGSPIKDPSEYEETKNDLENAKPDWCLASQRLNDLKK